MATRALQWLNVLRQATSLSPPLPSSPPSLPLRPLSCCTAGRPLAPPCRHASSASTASCPNSATHPQDLPRPQLPRPQCLPSPPPAPSEHTQHAAPVSMATHIVNRRVGRGGPTTGATLPPRPTLLTPPVPGWLGPAAGVFQLHSSPLWPNTSPVSHHHEGCPAPLLRGPVRSVEQLRKLLEEKQAFIYEDVSARNINREAVFTNSELSLKHVEVYGFDFDYTLVHYTGELNCTIFERARNRLVEKLNYPHGIRDIEFNPKFAIRGLHCDTTEGLLMKIDAYNHIQLGSVYRGHTPVCAEEVVELYNGTHIPAHVLDQTPGTGDTHMTQFLDLFSIPEATLFADISEYLTTNSIDFDPEYLFADVQATIKDVHLLGDIHKAIMSDLRRYVHPAQKLPEFLSRLKRANKKMFIITNSPWELVNKVMSYQLGSHDWRDLFDVIIVEARKPSFYEEDGPFRCLNSDGMTPTWRRVARLEPGLVYQQGNVADLIRMTGWKGAQVLYFGDHVFSDLAEPQLKHGWKTGAILPELEMEIGAASLKKSRSALAKLISLESLLQEHQSYCYSDPALLDLLEHWKQERAEARHLLKDMYNLRFGSVFRTEKNATYFSRRLATYSNLYMSSLDCLMNYSLDYTFIPRRQSLPHEIDLNFDI